ncbi:hypothetical protein SAMN04487948_12711 [Halogranum amylolyticum]|uniref:Flagellin N-terminal-like domain-containing protein n=2 Tax=Halogranum amylolyticum TaxID=660520 RepID=A0A1H8WCS0_9EURY|nr:hypothetical protein SAMN04487948_12711 [Halogranum amylolyticum]
MFSYEIFKLYLVSVKHNRSVNDTRYEMYQTSLILILVAIVALVFLSFGEYFVSAFAAPKASSEAVNKSYMFDMFQ